MDVIDFELKRYEIMKNDLETRKNPNTKSKDNNSKSADYLDSIMNEEKPKEVRYIILLNSMLKNDSITFCFQTTDGITKKTYSRIKTKTKTKIR